MLVHSRRLSTHRSPLLTVLLLLAAAPACGGSSTNGAGTRGGDGGDNDATTLSEAGSTGDDAAVDGAIGATLDATMDAPPGAGDAAAGNDAATANDAGTLAEPPMSGPPNPGDGTGSVTFAITKFYVGDTDPDGTPDTMNGWTHYGFDLDGLSPGVNPSSLCIPVGNANPAQVHQRGPGGLQNAFGHDVLPIMRGISSNYSSLINSALSSGQARPLFTLQKLGAGTEYSPLTGDQYQALALGSPPKYDGTDVFPLDPRFLNGMTAATPQTVYGGAYVTGNTWVSGPLAPSSLQFPLLLAAFESTVSVSVAQIAMPLASNHQSVSQGTLAGVVPTAALVAAFRQLAGEFDPSLCPGATIESIVTQIANASDIMSDGTQDPTKTCNGISFGLGFDASVVQLGAVGQVPPPPPNPCGGGSDAGNDASSDAGPDAASTEAGVGAGAVPTTCQQADNTVGCCVGDVLYFCSAGMNVTQQACATGTVCGWNAAGPYYDCVMLPGGSDPSKTYPIACQ
jgi:hypothetical protein